MTSHENSYCFPETEGWSSTGEFLAARNSLACLGFNLSNEGGRVRLFSTNRRRPTNKCLSKATKVLAQHQIKCDWVVLAGAVLLDRLDALAGMPMTSLFLGGTSVKDLEPLSGMRLHALQLSFTPITCLDPLEGMPLIWASLSGTKVSSIEALRRSRLEWLSLSGTRVRSVEPLKGQPLRHLSVHGRKIESLAPLKGMNVRVSGASPELLATME